MQTNKTPLSRLISVDVIRVLALLMVIVLHTILNFTIRPDFFATKLWFTLEPLAALSKASILLFFMLSGFLVINKNRSIKDNLQKTIKRIVVPLCFFSVLNIVIAFAKFHSSGTNGIGFWQGQLVRVTNFPSSWLWFLVVLIFLYLLNPVWQLIFSNTKNRNIALYLVTLTFLFSIFATFIKFPSLKDLVFYNNFTGWLGYLSLYLYGGLVRNEWISINHKKLNIALVIIGLFTIMAGDYYTSFAKIHSLNFIWSGYFFEYLSLPDILMSIGMFNLLIKLDYGWFTDNNLGKILLKLIQWLAGLSFGIYLIHSYVVSIFTDILGFSFDNLTINVYLYNILNYGLVLGISTIITYAITKIPKLKMIIGE
jgi:surface polysaccharide O-acyltransferase-like enzyme